MSTDHKRVFSQLRTGDNTTCVDCAQRNPQWASFSLGIYLCIDCSGFHRSIGVTYSKVRSLVLDKWTEDQLQMMKSGGNKQIKDFFQQQQYPSNLSIEQRYTSPTTQIYRDWLLKKAQGENPGPIPFIGYKSAPVQSIFDNTSNNNNNNSNIAPSTNHNNSNNNNNNNNSNISNHNQGGNRHQPAPSSYSSNHNYSSNSTSSGSSSSKYEGFGSGGYTPRSNTYNTSTDPNGDWWNAFVTTASSVASVAANAAIVGTTYAAEGVSNLAQSAQTVGIQTTLQESFKAVNQFVSTNIIGSTDAEMYVPQNSLPSDSNTNSGDKQQYITIKPRTGTKYEGFGSGSVQTNNNNNNNNNTTAYNSGNQGRNLYGTNDDYDDTNNNDSNDWNTGTSKQNKPLKPTFPVSFDDFEPQSSPPKNNTKSLPTKKNKKSSEGTKETKLPTAPTSTGVETLFNVDFSAQPLAVSSHPTQTSPPIPKSAQTPTTAHINPAAEAPDSFDNFFANQPSIVTPNPSAVAPPATFKTLPTFKPLPSFNPPQIQPKTHSHSLTNTTAEQPFDNSFFASLSSNNIAGTTFNPPSASATVPQEQPHTQPATPFTQPAQQLSHGQSQPQNHQNHQNQSPPSHNDPLDTLFDDFLHLEPGQKLPTTQPVQPFQPVQPAQPSPSTNLPQPPKSTQFATPPVALNPLPVFKPLQPAVIKPLPVFQPLQAPTKAANQPQPLSQSQPPLSQPELPQPQLENDFDSFFA